MLLSSVRRKSKTTETTIVLFSSCAGLSFGHEDSCIPGSSPPAALFCADLNTMERDVEQTLGEIYLYAHEHEELKS